MSVAAGTGGGGDRFSSTTVRAKLYETSKRAEGDRATERWWSGARVLSLCQQTASGRLFHAR
jgi:hypothetical protein